MTGTNSGLAILENEVASAGTVVDPVLAGIVTSCSKLYVAAARVLE